uniref:Ionotropic glutamate receptor L-glutamate and glycine-binding domain-containing protein n=1 Tax=Anopheles christyi TaxID=43041 RepID=A0A182JW04_9DIPT
MKGPLILSIYIATALCEMAPISYLEEVKYNHLTAPLATHFKGTKFPVIFWMDSAVYVTNRSTQLDTLNAIVLAQHDWMSSVFRNSLRCIRINRLQNVFIAATARSLKKLLTSLEYDCFYPTGLYIFIATEQFESEDSVRDVFEAVWKIRILNVVFVVQSNDTMFRAYGYEPYEYGNCGIVRLKLVDQYRNNRWHRLGDWFVRSLPNFHQCPLKTVTFESKPFVMLSTVGNTTRYFGLEVKIFRHIAAKLNFTIEYVAPPNNLKWGILLPRNSTGQMGMLQRNEADVGFGSVGRSIERNILLRSSVPSIVSQLTMAIPPKLPYTSLEKLFLPFTLSAWLLVAAGYTIILCLYVVLFRSKHHPHLEHIPDLLYTCWTILMGGPGRDVHRHSTRIYIVSLVLNALIVRNLYQSALFQRLKSNDVMAANLHTYKDINEAGLSYYMYATTAKYFFDNPDVNHTIRSITDENIDWDDVMYNISQHQLPGVIPLPLESVAYYVKHRGQQQGMVYVSEHTSISYYIAFHFPRMSALQRPFDHLLNRLQASGFIMYWISHYRNNPHSWMNYEHDSVPTPLQLQQVSGGFYLWAIGMLGGAIVFVAEIIVSKLSRVRKYNVHCIFSCIVTRSEKPRIMLFQIAFVIAVTQSHCCAYSLITLMENGMDTEHLQTPLRKHFKYPLFPVNFRVVSGENRKRSRELFEINELMLENSDWLVGTVSDRLPIETNRYASFYNVLFANTYHSMMNILQSLTYHDYDPSGRCLLVINTVFEVEYLLQLMTVLWKLRIVNVVAIVQGPAGESYRAYNYHPFREGKCDQLEPILLDQFLNGRWQTLPQWYRNKLHNFNGCSIRVGTIAAKPYSMVRQEGNATVRFGMEVSIVENIAQWFNFTIKYSSPNGTVKWGIIREENSTGLMGMIQRQEVDFGFGCMGYNELRNRYLKLGLQSFITHLSLAVPPARPFTWLEKLFQPFTPAAWLCIALCYTGYILLMVLIFDTNLIITTVEHFRNPTYNLWVMLMGGPSRSLRRSSNRLFIIGFVLNALVIRTMFGSAMFERLQATTSLESHLDTFQQINEEDMLYYMYITTSFYYKDNPLPAGQVIIRILWDETRDWDEVMYNISHYKLKGVFVIPLDAIEYYVKNYGQSGLVYVSKHTGINYNPGFLYPQASPLTEPFSAIIGRYQAAGLIPIWREQFRDTRYWNNAKLHPEPISLHWSHLSGGFYLWACMLAVSVVGISQWEEDIKMRLSFIALLLLVHSVLKVAGYLLNDKASPLDELLSTIVRTHYRLPESFVAIRVRNGASSKPSVLQQDLIDNLMRTSGDCFSVTFEDLPASEGRPAYYSVYLVQDYHSLFTLLD